MFLPLCKVIINVPVLFQPSVYHLNIGDRYMGYNIRLVEDIIEYYEHKQKKGLLFMADFSKAFDTLE